MPKAKEIKNLADFLQWLITGILVPVIVFLFSQVDALKKEMYLFEVKVATDTAKFARREDIVRMEQKIDDLKDLIIREIKKK